MLIIIGIALVLLEALVLWIYPGLGKYILMALGSA